MALGYHLRASKSAGTHKHPLGLPCGLRRSTLWPLAIFRTDAPGKNKNAGNRNSPSRASLRAPAFYALASVDMQDDLRFAVPAKNRQAIRLGLRGDPQQSLVSPTHWAGDPSVLRDQCITFGFYSQPIFASFFRLCLNKSQDTSIKLSYSFIPYRSFSKLKHFFFHRFSRL